MRKSGGLFLLLQAAFICAIDKSLFMLVQRRSEAPLAGVRGSKARTGCWRRLQLRGECGDVQLQLQRCPSEPVAPLVQRVRAKWKCKMAAQEGSSSLRILASNQATVEDNETLKIPFPREHQALFLLGEIKVLTPDRNI